MNKKIIVAAAISGALAVVLGAFGAHGVKPLIPEKSYLTYGTAVQYHFYHTFAIFVAAILSEKFEKKWLVWASWTFLAGILLFSGSLYLLSTSSLLGLDAFRRILGPMTPIGGLAFIVGWIFVGVAAMKHPKY